MHTFLNVPTLGIGCFGFRRGNITLIHGTPGVAGLLSQDGLTGSTVAMFESDSDGMPTGGCLRAVCGRVEFNLYAYYIYIYYEHFDGKYAKYT